MCLFMAQVAVQFLEVHHEEVRDLLGDAGAPRQSGEPPAC